MADLKKKMLVDKSSYYPEDVYAQDPTTRLRALEQTENIPDATIPAVANAAMFTLPQPLLSRLQYFNNVRQAYNTFRYGGNKQDYVNAGMTALGPVGLGLPARLKRIFSGQ